MKILYITPTLQHPELRGSHRHYHFIRGLSQRHAITLLSLERSPVTDAVRQEMTSYTNQLITFKTNGSKTNGSMPVHEQTLISRLPLLGRPLAQQAALRKSVEQMKETFTQLVQREQFDVVLFHGKDCFHTIEDWHGLPIVTDFCDATSLRIRTKMRHVNPAMALMLGLRYLQVRRVEKKMVESTPHIAFISQRDRAAILGPASHAAVIPNGLDLHYWTRRTWSPQPDCLIFTGVMDYSPNEDAALRLINKILPRLRPLVPNVRLIIAGRNPTPALRKQAEPFPDVVVTGYVEDLRDYLEQATLFVAPLRYASGMQNKLQEALSMQIPVVTTSVAADGLQVADGAEPPVSIADQDDLFVQQVADLLQKPAERAELAQRGRRFAEKYFSWAESTAHFERMCLDAVAKR